MKLSVRLIVVLFCAALVISMPFFLSSPSMLSEAREALTDSQEEDDGGVDLDFGRLFMPYAMAENSGLVVEELDADGKLSIPEEWALPFDFSLAPLPDPDCYKENGYEDQSIRIRTEIREMFNSNVNIAYVEIAHPSQLRTATAGPINVNKAHYVKTIAVNNNAVIAINGDDYVKMDSKKDKSFEIRMTEFVTQDHKRSKTYKDHDILVIDKQGDFHLFLLADGLEEYFKQNNEDVVQAFSFGPALVVDGMMQNLEDRKSVYAGTYKNPRAAIGQKGPLSYVLVVVESQKRGDGSGVTHAELAQIMSELGCIQAYNLDGGNSAEMVMPWYDLDQNKSKDHDPVFYCKGDNAAKVRPQSDIIYFATAVPEEERK